MQKVYIFDLDGTLIDSMTIAWGWILTKFLDERGVQYPSDIIKRVITLGFPGIVKYYKENFHIQDKSEDMMNYFLDGLQGMYENEIPAKPHVIETLKALKAQGASLNVLTASPHRFLDPCLKRLGIFELFDNKWTLEDFTVTKADPRIYTEAASRLGVGTEDCVMVDDSIGAIRPSKGAGMRTIGVYDEISAEYEAEMRETADLYIRDFSEILARDV